MSLWWQHTPNRSWSDPKALCHDNSLAVMTTVAIECVLLVVDWGLERQKACRLPMGMDTAHKRNADGLCIERLGVYSGVDTNSVTVVATHSKPVME